MIRKHTQDDLAQILEVWKAANKLAHPFLDLDFVITVEKDMKNKYIPNSETWVYEEENKIVGFISMIKNEIGGLFVDPKHHSMGIGTKLVDFIKPQHNHLEVEVFEKNSIGRSFYKKYGFHPQKSYLMEATNEMVLRLILNQNT